MASKNYTLADRYVADDVTVFLSGIQALARVPVEQMMADRRAGLNTATYVSGYPGSPLGGFNNAIDEAARLRPELNIHHQFGLNEEYAATSVMGSQLVTALDGAKYQGVLGIWYGKAPGLDRASDALRHACYAGASRYGGAVAFVGDDPAAKSSTLPSSSAGVLADLHMPLFYPADPAEVLDLGRHAVALSRASGLWTALKIVADVADGTASVALDSDRVQPVLPLVDDQPYATNPKAFLITPFSVDVEREIYEVRYPLALQYAALNNLNRSTVDTAGAWIGIVASGITYREVREALEHLGLATDADIASCGIRLFKMQMPIPFDPASLRAFARGLEEIVVVEEKLPSIEALIKDALYGEAQRPRIVGKTDERDEVLFPSFGSLTADSIAPALRRRLGARLGDRLAPAPSKRRALIKLSMERAPFYCSGCPHNRSTEAPEGSLVGAGIGCHTMALLIGGERLGDITGITCMGSEGTQWIGMAPFIEREHFIQNLGDGTFFHSGQLAITAAIAADVNITYKLLYNGAIAMTGGQTPQGQLSVGAVARNLLTQGVAKVVVTADDTTRYKHGDLPDEVEVWPRQRLIEAQETLAQVKGVTVLIHDQACAAEARRARKRGLIPTPSKRIVINQRICEGCGDCGQVSNCLSVQPVDTPFGRKTQIDQTTCNLDYSCIEGDCPSFVEIDLQPPRWQRVLYRKKKGPRTKRPPAVAAVELPAPAEPIVPTVEFAVRITGIGGTGVVTVAQVLGTAAMRDGYTVRGLDQIGLSQKAGPVVSDLRFTRGGDSETNRLGEGQADLLLALDQLVGASAKGVLTLAPRTVVVGSNSRVPTGAMVAHPELASPTPTELADVIARDSDLAHQYWADAEAITTAVFGDAVTANIFVVGFAVQLGALPVRPEYVEEAIELNGAAVAVNLAAFRLGRRFAVDPAAVLAVIPAAASPPAPPAALAARVAAFGDELAFEVARYTVELAAFQNEAYAARYVTTLERVRAAEEAVDPTSTQLTAAVAANFFKLLAYKDEYEVARLMLDRAARADADALAGDTGIARQLLHPPLLRALGIERKVAFGPATRPLIRLLAAGKPLRGRWLDPFGKPEVRREERRLIREYEQAVDALLAGLSRANLAAAVAAAALPDLVRGYEHLKLQRIAQYRQRMKEALDAFGNP